MEHEVLYRPLQLWSGAPGRILIQTRSPDAFLAWLIPQIPRKE